MRLSTEGCNANVLSCINIFFKFPINEELWLAFFSISFFMVDVISVSTVLEIFGSKLSKHRKEFLSAVYSKDLCSRAVQAC